MAISNHLPSHRPRKRPPGRSARTTCYAVKRAVSRYQTPGPVDCSPRPWDVRPGVSARMPKLPHFAPTRGALVRRERPFGNSLCPTARNGYAPKDTRYPSTSLAHEEHPVYTPPKRTETSKRLRSPRRLSRRTDQLLPRTEVSGGDRPGPRGQQPLPALARETRFHTRGGTPADGLHSRQIRRRPVVGNER